MCEYCRQEYCCLHGHWLRRFDGPGYPIYGWGPAYGREPSPADRRELLEGEKAALERRLMALEVRRKEPEAGATRA